MLPLHRQNSNLTKNSDLKLSKSGSNETYPLTDNALPRSKFPFALISLAFMGVFCLFSFSLETVVLSGAIVDFPARTPLQQETDRQTSFENTTSTGNIEALSAERRKENSQQKDTLSVKVMVPVQKSMARMEEQSTDTTGNVESLTSERPEESLQKDKLSLEQWQQVQTSIVSMECQPLVHSDSTATAGVSMALMVWAYDGPPDTQRLQDSIASLPKGTKVQLLCGSTECLERANRIRVTEQNACLDVSRLDVMELARDTPLATWADHHVLAKLLSGHRYEYHLQVAMQLAALWKFGGILLQPGVRYQAGQLDGAAGAIGSCEGSIAAAAPLWGGLWGVFAASPQSSWVNEMIANFLNEYSWDKPIRERYNPNSWPLAVNFQSLLPSSTSETASQISMGTACPDRSFVDGHEGPDTYFGTLSYDERHKYLVKAKNYGMNLGDETQGLAGIQALPRLDAFVERDRLEMVQLTDNTKPPLFHPNATHLSKDDGRRVHVFFNAWWGTPTMTWPPPHYIDPISLSMHFQPTVAIQNKVKQVPARVASKKPSKIKPADPSSPVAPYLKSQAPIGARDTKTLAFLREIGIQALFSACMTMTLSLPKVERDNSVLIVDVDSEKQLRGSIPDTVLEGSTFLTQKLVDHDADDNVLRFALAFERLLAYSRARLVITNRLHVAMPCVALGTPVIFVHGQSLPGGGGNRMDGLDVFMHQMHENTPLPEDFNWEDPPVNPRGDDFKKQVKRIKQLAICHSGISDSSRKFGYIPGDWAAGEEHQVCTRESAWIANPDAIHIATSIDANFFELVFPSWVNALAKSNPHEPLVIYILTVELSDKQRCLLRLMVLKLLPNATVFTIPTNVADFEKSYNLVDHHHISVATQARLLMPSLLPCVQKLLWIDLDAFVVGPIRQAWNEPTGKCGISARNSIMRKYMAQDGKYPTLANWHIIYGRSFNAGVMVIDLQQLRESKFEETIVRYWAIELGANDQVTFNIACNASHAELDPRMNVFQGQKSEYTPKRSEWVIVHFQSNRKPWSADWDSSWSSSGFWQIWVKNKMTFEQVLDL